jgi:cytochrome c oxidase assembly factor CtaG
MLQHVLIGDAAVALALVAVRGPLVLFLLPPLVLRPLGRSRGVRATLGLLFRPAVALAAWAVVIAAWHVPAVYDYALSHRTVHDLEHLSFVVVGVLVWTQLIDPARRGHLSPVQRLGYAGLLFALGMVLADVMIFSFHPLYPAYAHQQVRLWGVSPLRDQQLAGLVMTLEQLLTLGICAAILLRLVARRRPTPAPRPVQART